MTTNGVVGEESVGGVLPSAITIEDGNFTIDGHVFLYDVPSNIVVTPASAVCCDAKCLDLNRGCFVGFDSPNGHPRDRHVASLGCLLGIPFLSIFRFKVWWTTQWVGSNGRDIENETQFLILDKSADRPHIVVLPIIDGRFRASLQPGHNDNLDVCVESGSTRVTESSFRTAVYMHAAPDDNPFAAIKSAIKVVREHLGTFKLLEEKTPPAIVDKLGWCTWDAFYLKVHPGGILEGVKALADGGCPPGFLIIDDGWQTIALDEDDEDNDDMDLTSAGEQMPCRLTRFEENHKFKNMKEFTAELRDQFGCLKEIYVWHALCGYWGGVRPGSKGMPKAMVMKPWLSKGLELTMKDLAVDKIVNNGIGLVGPQEVHQFYDRLHSHLSQVGISGVKIDVIHVLEMIAEEYGGRVDLAKAYFSALTASVNRHFNGNNVIASMEHCNDFMLLGTTSISLGRVGDDFWCTDPNGDPNGTYWLQGCHMVHCAYNSLWMGTVIQPDWDMFQTNHACAQFHAASRAISGGPIYISDCVGEHDFNLLKSVALPDGTILRCEHYALPTRDCLFSDPLHDGNTMLKIWNLNKFTGVLGAFNCQGGGWCRKTRRNKCFSEFSRRLTAIARSTDIEWDVGNHKIDVENVQMFAVYWFNEAKLELLHKEDCMKISLEPFEFELLTVSPILRMVSFGVQFAPIGLVNMLNSGGSIKSLEVFEEGRMVHVGVKGKGSFKAFSSELPCKCLINGDVVELSYNEGILTVQVPWPESVAVSEMQLFY